MISRRTLLALAAATPALAVRAAPRSTSEVMVAVPNNVYANMSDGRPTGVMVEAIDYILRSMGLRPTYIVMPASDVTAAFGDGTVAVNSVAVQTASNAEKYLFSSPIVTESNVVAVRADQTLVLERISDLYGLKLGGRTGYQYPLLDSDPRITLQRFEQDGELIRNLIHKRIDAAIISAISDVYKLRAEGVMTRIRILGKSVGEVPLRAALSRARFTETDRRRFDDTLAQLQGGVVWNEIIEHNGVADLFAPWPQVEH